MEKNPNKAQQILTLAQSYRVLNYRRHSRYSPLNTTQESPLPMHTAGMIELHTTVIHDNNGSNVISGVSKERSCFRLNSLSSATNAGNRMAIFQSQEIVTCELGFIKLVDEYQHLGLFIHDQILINHDGIVEFSLSQVNDTDAPISLYVTYPILTFTKVR